MYTFHSQIHLMHLINQPHPPYPPPNPLPHPRAKSGRHMTPSPDVPHRMQPPPPAVRLSRLHKSTYIFTSHDRTARRRRLTAAMTTTTGRAGRTGKSGQYHPETAALLLPLITPTEHIRTQLHTFLGHGTRARAQVQGTPPAKCGIPFPH